MGNIVLKTRTQLFSERDWLWDLGEKMEARGWDLWGGCALTHELLSLSVLGRGEEPGCYLITRYPL